MAWRAPRCTRRGTAARAPSAAAHCSAAAWALRTDTTRSSLPWITSRGGRFPRSTAVSGRLRPRIAASAPAAERAAPGATPACIATAQKRSGQRTASRAAMLAPADNPATATAPRSTG